MALHTKKCVPGADPSECHIIMSAFIFFRENCNPKMQDARFIGQMVIGSTSVYEVIRFVVRVSDT